jgi:putative FmdB family regulatory protein
MPLYEYECPKCKRTQEMSQKIGDPPPLCCEEECGGLEMKKLISLSSFRLKGKGWYKTDYAGKK